MKYSEFKQKVIYGPKGPLYYAVKHLGAVLLEELEKHANEAVDKLRTSIISLSGGALGSTIIFLKDIVGLDNRCALNLVKGAWVLWLFSICVTLFSFFCQYQSLLFQLKGEQENVRYLVAGKWGKAMGYSYMAGAVGFVVGVVLVAVAVLLTI